MHHFTPSPAMVPTEWESAPAAAWFAPSTATATITTSASALRVDDDDDSAPSPVMHGWQVLQERDLSRTAPRFTVTERFVSSGSPTLLTATAASATPWYPPQTAEDMHVDGDGDHEDDWNAQQWRVKAWLATPDVSPQQITAEARSPPFRVETSCDAAVPSGTTLVMVTAGVQGEDVNALEIAAALVTPPDTPVAVNASPLGRVKQVIPGDDARSPTTSVVEVGACFVDGDDAAEQAVVTALLPLACPALKRLLSPSCGAMFALALSDSDASGVVQRAAFTECVLWLLLQRLPQTVTVYGGAIRDYVLRGVDITDIDVCIPDDMPKNWTRDQLQRALDTSPLHARVRIAPLDPKRGVHERFTATLFKRDCSQGSPKEVDVHRVEIECVAEHAFAVTGAGSDGLHIDCSFNNVALDREGLRQRHPGEGPRLLSCLHDVATLAGTAVRQPRDERDLWYLSNRYLTRLQLASPQRQFAIENVAVVMSCVCPPPTCVCFRPPMLRLAVPWNVCPRYAVNAFHFIRLS